MLQKLLLRVAELSLVLVLIAAILLAWRQERADRAQLQSQLSAANQALAAATASQQSRDARLADTLAAIAAQKKAAASLTPDQLLAAIAGVASLPSPLALRPATGAAGPATDAALTASGTYGTPPLPLNSAISPAAPTAGNQPARVPEVLPEQAAASANPPPPRGSRPRFISAPGTSADLPAASSPSADLPAAPAVQIPTSDLGPLYSYLLDCKACQAKLTVAQNDLADEKTKTATLAQSRDAALKAAKGGSVWQRTTRALKWLAIGAAAGAIAAKTRR